MEYSGAFVSLMGMGTVFFGLICLIVLTGLMGRVVGQKTAEKEAAAAPIPAVRSTVDPAFVAAVSAAIAEDLGTDITGIRILSIKKL